MEPEGGEVFSILRKRASNQEIVCAGVTSPCRVTLFRLWHYVVDFVADSLKIRASCGFGVIDSAFDGVGYDALWMEAAAYGVGFHANSNQIIALKQSRASFRLIPMV